jgi:hypothetical protein
VKGATCHLPIRLVIQTRGTIRLGHMLPVRTTYPERPSNILYELHRLDDRHPQYGLLAPGLRHPFSMNYARVCNRRSCHDMGGGGRQMFPLA